MDTDAPNLTTRLEVRPRFVADMACEPGRPMIAPLGDDELERRPAA